MIETVASLRKKGWRVGVRHTRTFQGTPWVSPYGGMTEVSITPPGEEKYWKGEARCNPRDHYTKRIGVAIALGRALKSWGGEQ